MIAMVGGLGLALGFLAGIALDDALDLWIASRRARTTRKEPRMHRPTTDTILRAGLILILVANTVLGVLLIQQRATSGNFAECVATYQRDFGRAYAARTTAAQKTSDALDRLVVAVARDDAKAFQRALDAYVVARETQQAERRRNPFPPVPTELCGDPRP